MPLDDQKEKEIQESVGMLKFLNPLLKLLGFGDVHGETKAAVDVAMAGNQQHKQALKGAEEMVGPQWEPIHGVHLDTYAKIMAGILRDELYGVEAVTAFAESHGVPPGKWGEVQTGWTMRSAKYMEVGIRLQQVQAQFA